MELVIGTTIAHMTTTPDSVTGIKTGSVTRAKKEGDLTKTRGVGNTLPFVPGVPPDRQYLSNTMSRDGARQVALWDQRATFLPVLEALEQLGVTTCERK